MKYIFLFLPLFASCGKNLEDVIYKNYEPDRKNTHSDFIPYLEELEIHFGKVKSSVIYDSPEKNKNWVGVCRKWNNSDYREIAIEKKYWDSIDDNGKKQLLMHELGHCELDKGHNDIEDGYCPVSVMRSYAFNQNELDNCFDINFNYYLEELLDI